MSDVLHLQLRMHPMRAIRSGDRELALSLARARSDVSDLAALLSAEPWSFSPGLLA